MPITIELPSRDSQLAFNKKRWAEVVADPEWADTPGRIETNRHGQILVMPPASGRHTIQKPKSHRSFAVAMMTTAVTSKPTALT